MPADMARIHADNFEGGHHFGAEHVIAHAADQAHILSAEQRGGGGLVQRFAARRHGGFGGMHGAIRLYPIWRLKYEIVNQRADDNDTGHFWVPCASTVLMSL